jgi:hypothetical protein
MTPTAVGEGGPEDFHRIYEQVREARAHVNAAISQLRLMPGGVLAESPRSCVYCDDGEASGSRRCVCVCEAPCWNRDCPRAEAGPMATSPTAPGRQDRERAALIQCARALAFGYAGSPRPSETSPEDRAMWDAMHAAYDALGVTDTRNLPAS